ncbi:MAG: hypothetical protein QG671_3293, partial [Actinomycetota bacterium]|nr:hypothetical protein [Actinomycetota bacterium]
SLVTADDLDTEIVGAEGCADRCFRQPCQGR